MRRLTILCLMLAALNFAGVMDAQDDSSAPVPFTADQLDNLLAPVALYPDALLAQILLAATFPDQVDEAARFLRGNGDPNAIDPQAWDVSVKAVAHYPPVLQVMADNLDWTTALGQAWILQPEDVLASIQRLRLEAQSVGNLDTNDYQQVFAYDGYLEIWREQPQYIYVPQYDCSVVYFGRAGSEVGFTRGFLIGAWLNHDLDWRGRLIIYVNWRKSTGWRPRSLPYVQLNSVYVNRTLADVSVNRDVLRRKVNYGELAHYDSVHASTSYGADPARPAEVNNKVIERNIDTKDPRIAAYRGHQTPSQQPKQPRHAEAQRNAEVPVPPIVRARPVEQPSAFGAGSSAFNAREASERGQQSRQEMARPAPQPAPQPVPQPRPAPPAEDKKR